MRNRVWAGVLVGLLAVGATAQTAKDAEKNLRETLVNGKKQMFLRGFSEDTTIHWKWDGKELVQDEPRFLTLGAVTVKSVKVNGERVVIQGDRQILVRTDGNNVQFSAPTVPVTIDLDLHGANLAEVMPTLPNLLFYRDFSDAVQHIPEIYADFVPTPAGYKLPASTCDCAHPSDCTDSVPLISMQGIVPPKVKIPDSPSSTAHVSGPASFVLAVDDTGKVQHVWLGRPRDPEFDNTEMNTLKAYSLFPATCHDKPIGVAMELNLQYVAGADSSPSRGKR